MDVGGLVAALASAQGTTPPRGAVAAASTDPVAPGFGTALARALGAPPAVPVPVDGATASDTAAAQLRALLGALRGEAPVAVPTEEDADAPLAVDAGDERDATEPADGVSHGMRASEPRRSSVEHGAPRTIPVPPRHMPAVDPEAPVASVDPEPGARAAAAPVIAAAAPPAKAEPASTKSVERSLSSLSPAFRTRLERVVERMRDELGLEVRVVETFRSQARQDALYAQGRTQPGPTVTWTRSSNHTLGLAADVRVEGGDAPKAYAALARVAAEEGLRTLGPDDPGHVELADDVAPPVRTTREDLRPAPMNGVARVARVATVAAPARVAQVAQVAVPGSRPAASAAPVKAAPHAATPTLPAPAAPRAAEAVASAPARAIEVPTPLSPGATAVGRTPPAREAPRAAAVAQAATNADTTTKAERPRETRAHDVAREPMVRTETPLAAAARDAQPAAETNQPAPTPATQGTDIAGRVARLMALRDATADAPATGMTLLLDGAEGTEARVRLAVRGSTIGATIDVADPAEAMKLGNRIGELRRALERQGLEPAAVTVRDVPHVRELGEKATQGVTLAAGAAGVIETPAGTRSGDAGSDRPSAQHRRDPGTAEDRPRRNPKEGRK